MKVYRATATLKARRETHQKQSAKLKCWGVVSQPP